MSTQTPGGCSSGGAGILAPAGPEARLNHGSVDLNPEQGLICSTQVSPKRFSRQGGERQRLEVGSQELMVKTHTCNNPVLPHGC